jgi:outer membrane autotransporter protein
MTVNAAQTFPQSGGIARVSHLGVLALMLGTVALPVSGAWAQQVLTGAQTTTQSPTVATGSPLVVTTALGFGVNTTSPTIATGVGIDLSSTGGISFTDTNQATITGFYRGIRARNIDAAGLGGDGGTALTITTTGHVTGKDIPPGGNYYYGEDGDGIWAENQYGGDLTISVASVTGDRKGIDANGIGNTGALTITATGVVTGTNDSGIDAYNQGTNLTISANSVLGGIEAESKGTGALSITATGDVTDAIFAQNKYGTSLTINAAEVSGLVYAKNDGTGALSITASGDVTAQFNDAINAFNQGTDLTISATSVSGGAGGIKAQNNGSGVLSITATGAVTDGTYYDGILANNSSTGTDLTIAVASVSGGYYGINAVNNGSGELEITATGAVTGTNYDGIYAYGKGTDLTISAASVSGGDDGIKAENHGSGALEITATGPVTGTGGDGIYAYGKGTSLTISAADVSARDIGISAKNAGNGPISITVSGDVSATAIFNGPGSQPGIGIRSDSGSGDAVTINLLSNSSVNAQYAIVDYLGDAEVTISGGAQVTGLIALQDGNDTLTIGSGTTISGVNMMIGGDGIDTLNISSGWSGNLDDWEVINADTSGGDFALDGFSLGGRSLGKTGDGTLTLNGVLTLASGSGLLMGSTLSMGVPQSAAAPLILATGAATIAGNLVVTPGQTLTFGQDYTLIEASALTGTFDNVSISGGYTTTLTYTGTSVLLRFDLDTPVTPDGFGVYATNTSAGPLAITTSGAISGAANDGIYAYNSSNGSDLTIAAVHSVSGDINGISATNNGTGKLEITTAGTVSGGTGAGISTNSADGATVEINVLSTSSVTATSGVAIEDGDGNAVVTVDAGAVIEGSISLGAGDDTLNIASGVDLYDGTGLIVADAVAFRAAPQNSPHVAFLSYVTVPVPVLSGGPGNDTLNINSDFAGQLSDWEVINADTTDGDFTLGGGVTGSGAFHKFGTGELLLSGNNSFTSEVTLNAGRLTLDGTLAGATFTMNSGSTLSMGVPQSWVDPIISTTGAATIAGNLVVTPGQALTFGQDYTLIEASALTGTFDNVSISGGYTTTLTYTGTSVLLRFNANSLLALGGNTLSPNAYAVAAAFDEAVAGGYNPQAFVDLYAQANNFDAAVSQFSGELHSAERRVALGDTQVVRDAALDRLGDGLTGGAGANFGESGTFWAQGLGSRGTADADGTGSRATTLQTGVLIGADVVQGDVKYGGMFSYTNTDVDLGTLGSSKVTSTGAALYAGYRQDGSGLAFGMGGALASTSAKGERSISLTGLEQTLTSTVQGNSYQIFGEVSNDLAKAGNVQIEPFARFAYTTVQSDAFAETGGIAALSGAKQSNDLRTAAFGLRGAYVAGDMTLSGSAAWLRNAGDLSAPTTLSMAGVNTPYEVNSAALAQDAVVLEAQASVDLARDMTLAGGYSGTIGKNNASHGVRVTLSVAW